MKRFQDTPAIQEHIRESIVNTLNQSLYSAMPRLRAEYIGLHGSRGRDFHHNGSDYDVMFVYDHRGADTRYWALKDALRIHGLSEYPDLMIDFQGVSIQSFMKKVNAFDTHTWEGLLNHPLSESVLRDDIFNKFNSDAFFLLLNRYAESAISTMALMVSSHLWKIPEKGTPGYETSRKKLHGALKAYIAYAEMVLILDSYLMVPMVEIKNLMLQGRQALRTRVKDRYANMMEPLIQLVLESDGSLDTSIKIIRESSELVPVNDSVAAVQKSITGIVDGIKKRNSIAQQEASNSQLHEPPLGEAKILAVEQFPQSFMKDYAVSSIR